MKLDLKILKENFEKNVRESHTMGLAQNPITNKYSQEVMNMKVTEFLDIVKTMDMNLYITLEKLLEKMSAETK